jgi:hypothetical protein
LWGATIRARAHGTPNDNNGEIVSSISLASQLFKRIHRDSHASGKKVSRVWGDPAREGWKEEWMEESVRPFFFLYL